MKKYSKFGWGFLVLAALALAGCGIKNQNQNQQSSSADTAQSVADSLKQGLYDLMTAGIDVKCTIKDPEMGQLTMYAKGDKVRVEGYPYISTSANFSGVPENGQLPVQEKGTMLNDGVWVYMWGSKDGMKFNIKDMQDMAAQNQDQSQENASDWKNWVKFMDEKGYKYDCGPAVLSDSDFMPPGNIQFEDLGEMMKGFVEMGQDMKDRLPDQPISPPSQ